MFSTLMSNGDPCSAVRSRPLFVVEKNAAVRRILELLFSGFGWKVQSFRTAGECIRMAVSLRPACILSDLYPIDMDAVEFRRTLLGRGIAAPLVILSAYPDSRLTATMKSLGVEEMLELPCNATAVEAAIARATGKDLHTPATAA